VTANPSDPTPVSDVTTDHRDPLATTRQLVDDLVAGRGVLPGRDPRLVNPVEIRFGRGAVAQLRDVVEGPVLVVSSRRALANPSVSAALHGLEPCTHVGDVEPYPSPAAVARVHRVARRVRPGTILALGGGSTLDLAKMVAAYADRSSPTLDDPPEDRPRSVRLVLVPTTAGTGAEVTPWATFWRAGGIKGSFDHPRCFGDVAIVDPALTDTMGPRLTAATGLDAFAHAVESIWTRHHRPVADTLALVALERLVEHLPAAVTAPSPKDRDAVSLAALLSGLALSQCRSAAAHGLSYALTGRYGIEHGLAVGLLCRALAPSVAARSPERIELIVGALGGDDVVAIAAFVDDVIRRAGIEPSLHALGVRRDALPKLAADGMATARFANQDGAWTHRDALHVLERIL
jgi:alcohol dehydrogenase class IV